MLLFNCMEERDPKVLLTPLAQAGVVLENNHSTDIKSPPSPPRLCMRCIVNKHSNDVESPPSLPYTPRVCMSIYSSR
jgi:hypothetical protein